MAIEILKIIFSTKVLYFTMLNELTKNGCFLSSFSGVAKFIFFFFCYQTSAINFCRQTFISLTVEELFLAEDNL